MKKLLLALLLLAGFAASAQAATKYVIPSAGSTGCTNGAVTYDPTASAGAGACGGGSATVYFGANINASAIAGASCSDVLEVRAGTYTTAIDDTSITWPSASAGCVFIIKNYLSEAPLFARANGASFSQTKSTTSYTIFQGLSFASTGDFNEVVGFQGHHLWFINTKSTANGLTVTQPNSGNVIIINPGAHHVTVTATSGGGSEISNPGVGPGCGIFSCDGYPAYVSGDDNVIEYTKVYNSRAYGIHNYHSDGSHASRNIYRSNWLTGTCQTLPTCSAILLGTGTDNQAYGNVIESTTGTGNGLISGIHIGNSSVRSSAYNNTVTGSKFAGISWDNSTSGATVKNNALQNNTRDFYNSSTDTSANPPSGTVSNNRCDVVDSRCAVTASPGFIDAAGHNYGLVVGSAMIDAGTASIASGITKSFNGAAPEIGAFETFGAASAEIGIVSTSTIDITFTDNVAQPLLPASAITGFTTTCGTISSAARSGNTHIRLVLVAPWGGGACTYSYSTGTGNVTNSALIGTTLNQRLNAITTVTVTDNTGGGGGPTLAYTHGKFYLIQGAVDTAWIAKAAEDVSPTIPPASKLNLRWKVKNTGTLVNLNPRVRVRYDGGSYVELTNSFVNGIKALGNGAQQGTVMTEGSSITQDQLTSDVANITCTYNRTATALPTLALATNTEAECAQAIEYDTSVTAGKVYDFLIYTDAGVAISGGPISNTIGSYGAGH